MPTVDFTHHLHRFFPQLKGKTPVQLPAEDNTLKTVRDAIDQLDKHFPGLAAYIIDDAGSLRKHVNIFVNKQPIRDRLKLSDPIDNTDAHILIMQALSGG